MASRIRLFLLLSFMLAAALALPALPGPARALAQQPPALTDEQKKLVNDVRDAVRAADAAVTAAEETRRSADGKVTRISNLVSFDQPDETALRQFEELDGAIRSAANPSLLTALEDSKTALTKAQTALTTARGALPAEATGQPAEIGAARKEANDALGRLDKQIAAQDKSKKSLQDTLNGVPGKVKALVDRFPERLADLSGIDKAAKHDALIPDLPDALPEFVEVVGIARVLRGRWNDVSAALKLAGAENAAANAEVTAAIDKVALDKADSATVKILQNLQPWMSELASHATAESGRAGALLPRVIEDAVNNGPEAQRLIAQTAPLNADLNRLGETWLDLAAVLDGVRVSGFKLADASQAAKDLSSASNKLNIAVSVLQDTLAGDATGFVGDKVSLFYFTDVERLMRMLNSATFQMGGIKGAREAAALERRRLTEVELDLSEAVSKVSGAQRRVLTLEEELRGARAAFSSAEEILRNTTRVLKTRQDDHKKAEDKKNAAKTAFDAAPDDPEKRAAFDRASEDFDRSTGRLQGAQERNEEATRQRDADKQRRDALADEQAGLPAKIQQARDDLAAAQASVVRQRRSAALAAQAESEAFAQARDNTPFWFGPAVAFGNDPVKRVLLFGFSDSKTIFLRGKPEDVSVVKNIIAQFDSPAPQARLTLWTMEMSSDTSPQGTKNFNKALIVIEEELANNRALTAAAVSFLRDCVNDEVNQVAAAELARFTAPVLGALKNDRYRVARLYFYQPEVAQRLGLPAEDIYNNQDRAKLAAEATSMLAPDPAGTTTLGEALMVLSLGKRIHRERIINKFRDQMKARLQALALHDTSDGDEDTWQKDGAGEFFTLTRRALGLDGVSLAREPLTSMQLEILHAAEKLALKRAAKRLDILLGQLRAVDAEMGAPRLNPLKRAQLQARRNNLVTPILVISDWIKAQTGLDPRFGAAGAGGARQVSAAQGEELSQLSELANEIDPLRTPNARVAAADQMLKELIIAVEDDIERTFVQRMLNRLRRRITRDKIGVGVGVMQRTSMLATNRLLARVDPRASAEVGVGSELNILDSTRQLAQIALATQAGGPLALFGALDRQPREAPPEVFGINTGNTFQVTPIFDPSGQALRFKFDFVGITRLQEPDGSTDRQLPRIERHTVNTEVQLSNLEMREISRFDSNARVGRPTEYKGGLPIIRDIPKVRPYLPLLGWFVRRGGKAAVVQESLIFGQTTIYPTIADIMDLLTPPL